MKISGKELEKIIKEEVSRYLGEEAPTDGEDKGSPEQNDKLTSRTIEKLGEAGGLAAVQRILPNSEEALVSVLSFIIKNAQRVNAQNKANAIRKLFANVKDVANAKVQE